MNTQFYSEVKKQPQSIRRTLEQYRKDGYSTLRHAAEIIRSAQAVVMSGMGTSYNVCLSALESFNRKVRVNAIQSYQLLNTGYAGVQDEDVLILISQSGESGEISRICRERKDKNSIIAVTNDIYSSLASSATVVLPLFCKEEKSITNCTFTATLAVLAMLSAAVNGDDVEDVARRLEYGSRIAETFLVDEHTIFSTADILGSSDRVHFIGRNGVEMTLAEQAALIFKEAADCNAQCFNVGSFRHGPMELCGQNHCFSHASDDVSMTVMQELRENGKTVAQ